MLANGLDAASGITSPDLNPNGSLGYHTNVTVLGKVTNSGVVEARDFSEVQFGQVVFDPVSGDYVFSGGTVTNTDTGVIKTGGASGVIEIGGSVANAGTIDATHGSIFLEGDGGLNNSGAVHVKFGLFEVGGATTNSSHITAEIGGTLSLNGATNNSGTIETQASSSIDFGGPVTNSGTVKIGGGHSYDSHDRSDFANSGSLLINGSSFEIGGALQNSNLVKAAANGIVMVDGDTRNTGTLEADGGSAIFIDGSLKNAQGELISDGGVIRVIGAANGGSASINYQGDSAFNSMHPDVLQLGGSIEFAAASNVAVAFQNTTANVLRELILDDSHDYRGQVSGFGHGDTIELGDINFSTTPGSATTFSYHDRHDGSGYLSVADADGHTAKINMIGTFSTSDFDIRSGYYTGGTMITHHGDTFLV